MQFIGVLDCNNFFVSCERLFRPDLAKVPVVVLSSNDGCVVARSQEIKDMGVPMGVPYFQIKDIIKDSGTVCFSSNFVLYRDLSERVFTVVAKVVPQLERYSIDEAFFVVETASVTEATELARRLKHRVEQEVGIPVSVALCGSKTQAKLLNSAIKRQEGALALDTTAFIERFSSEAIGTVWGVGRGLLARYKAAGILTIGDLLAASRERIETLFGVVGLRLQAELRGEVTSRVVTGRTLPKSMMSTRSFKKPTMDLAQIKDALAYHVRYVGEDLRQQRLCATAMTVVLQTARHGDYFRYGGSAQTSFVAPMADTTMLLPAALALLDSLFEAKVPYNKTGVIMHGLLPQAFVPASLFAGFNTAPEGSSIDRLLDNLTNRFGREVVKIGQFTKQANWQAKRDLVSNAYTTQWSEIKTVQA